MKQTAPMPKAYDDFLWRIRNGVIVMAIGIFVIAAGAISQHYLDMRMGLWGLIPIEWFGAFLFIVGFVTFIKQCAKRPDCARRVLSSLKGKFGK